MPHQLDGWRAWHEACALDLTPEPHRGPLRDFVAGRFRTYTLRYAYRTNHPNVHREIPKERECWHRFESWCAVHEHRDGKRYKDWIFSRGRRGLPDVESAASLLIRDVVRDWLRNEFSDASLRSLAEELIPGGTTLEQLLQSEADRPCAEAMMETCTPLVRSVQEHCARPEQVALVARRHGIPLSCVRVMRASGVGRSSLASRYQALVERIGWEVKRRLPDLDAAPATQLCLHLLDRLAEQFASQILPEISDVAAQEV